MAIGDRQDKPGGSRARPSALCQVARLMDPVRLERARFVEPLYHPLASIPQANVAQISAHGRAKSDLSQPLISAMARNSFFLIA